MESQSFLFRVWVEDPEAQAGSLDWRGHMTCLLDGTRVYVQSWIEIQAFIHSYLDTSSTRDPRPGINR